MRTVERVAHEHDDRRSERCASVARNSEELQEFVRCFITRFFLGFQKDMNIWVGDKQLSAEKATAEHTVEVPRSLEVGMAQAAQRLEGHRVAALHHVPPRRLRTEVDLNQENKRRKPCLSTHASVLHTCNPAAITETYATKHEAPIETTDAALIRNAAEREVHDIAEHDTERRPGLKHHHECPPNERRRTLCRVYGNRCTVGTETEAEEEAGDEEVLPGVGQALPYTYNEPDQSRQEDRTATT